MIFNKKLLLLSFIFLKAFSLDFSKKASVRTDFAQNDSSEDYNDVSFSEDPKAQDSDGDEISAPHDDAPKESDAGAAPKTDDPRADAACISLPATTAENEVETESSVEIYTDALCAVAAGSSQKVPCIVSISIDNSTATPEIAAINDAIARAFNALSPTMPYMLNVSSKPELDGYLSVDGGSGSSVTLATQQGANVLISEKPFDNFVSKCANSSLSGPVAQAATKLVEGSLLARAMNNQQKAPDFDSTTKYGPRYTEIVPKLTFRSSGDDIQNYIDSDQGMRIIQQAKCALLQNTQSIDRLNNASFWQAERSKVLTAYSKEIENKLVGYFVVSNKNIDTTLKQLSAEKSAIQERLASKQQDLHKLLSNKGISEGELEFLKIKLINTQDKMSPGSYNQLNLIMQIIPLQNEVIEACMQWRVNDTNINLAQQCMEINNQQLERLAQALSDDIIRKINTLDYKDAKAAMSILEEHKVKLEDQAVNYLAHQQAHVNNIAELNAKLSAIWLGKSEISAAIAKEVEFAEQAKLSHQSAAKCVEISSKIIGECREVIDKKALEITPEQALQKYEPIIQAQGYDSSTIQYHENNLAALYKYTEHSDLITAMSVTYQEGGAVVSAVYKLDSTVSAALERLGVDVHTINAEFTGNHVQHYVHRELIESLSKIATIEHTSPEVDQLLKIIVVLNSTGHALNARHEIVAALSVKQACDAVVDYAKTVADISFALAEGVVEGAVGTFHMLGAIGKETIDAITFPEQTIELVQTKFNNAILGIVKFFSGANMTREDHIYLFLHGDQQAIQEKFEQDKISGEKLVNFFKALEKKYYETAFKDKVKAVSRNFTEFALLGKIGGVLFEEGAAIADLINLEAEVACVEIKAILSNPQQAFAKEVVELAIKTVDKDAELVKGAIEFIQQDAEFLAAGQKDIVQKTSQFIEHLEAKSVRFDSYKTNRQKITKAELPQYWKSLIQDPAHGNKITFKTIDEALVGFASEQHGLLAGPLKRDVTGAAEFIDKFGQAWDVKMAISKAPNGRYIFNPTNLLQSIKRELSLGENIILDLRKLEVADISLLYENLIKNLTQQERSRIIAVIPNETLVKITG